MEKKTINLRLLKIKIELVYMFENWKRKETLYSKKDQNIFHTLAAKLNHQENSHGKLMKK